VYRTTVCVDSINRAAPNALKAETAIVDVAYSSDVEEGDPCADCV
jgi:hypothetical protein